jgi:nucleoid-associated protein YgaU
MAEDEAAVASGGKSAVTLPAVGKVPKTWLYVGAAAVAVLVGYAYFKSRTAGPAELVVDPATGATGETGYRNPAPQSGTTVPLPSTGADVIDTNAKWTTAVVGSLANIGIDSQFVSLAVSKYLASVPLTPDEANIIRQAWAFHGKPPGGPNTFTLIVPGAPTPPAPTPTPTPTPTPPAPTPPAPRTYTVVSGDTLYAISRKVYGTDARQGEIYRANSGVIESTAKAHGYSSSQNGHWIFPGTKLVIP